MKVKITTLKAPWPAGAKVGETVEFNGDGLPAWAAGKCVRVDGEKADHVYEPSTSGPVTVALSVDSEEVQRAFHQLREETVRRVAEADGKAEELAAENATLKARIAELEVERSKAVGIDAQADTERARQALEAEAKELGVPFHPNISDEKLAERVAEAKKAKA